MGGPLTWAGRIDSADEHERASGFTRGRKKPPARYFSVCLYNRWLESLDYIHHPVFVNHTYVVGSFVHERALAHGRAAPHSAPHSIGKS